MLLLTIALIGIRCDSEEIEEATIVYSNDFSGGSLELIQGGYISPFNNGNVLGPYNNDSFELLLFNIPPHRYLKVELDLYIHDWWDGNAVCPDGPDLWGFSLDDNQVVSTTFCNTYLEQSYPGRYFDVHPARSQASGYLPGFCGARSDPKGTSVYKLIYRLGHQGDKARLKFWDRLVQTNTDFVKNVLCDESWSMGKIQVSSVFVR